MIENLTGDAREPDSATSASTARPVKRATNGYVVLDSTWGRRLGVRRSGGLYRITRRELLARLNELQQAPPEQKQDPAQTANQPQRDDHTAPDTQPHVVVFYEAEAFLVDSVVDFLAPGLLAGDAATIVVATDAHRELFDRALTAAGVDLPAARRCGRYVVLDAAQALATFLADARPDPARFNTGVGEVVARAADSAREVRIYGEMVGLLWQEGNVAAAIALEDLWNDLATRYPFSLFCAYPMPASDTDTKAFRTICGQHSKVALQAHPT